MLGFWKCPLDVKDLTLNFHDSEIKNLLFGAEGLSTNLKLEFEGGLWRCNVGDWRVVLIVKLCPLVLVLLLVLLVLLRCWSQKEKKKKKEEHKWNVATVTPHGKTNKQEQCNIVQDYLPSLTTTPSTWIKFCRRQNDSNVPTEHFPLFPLFPSCFAVRWGVGGGRGLPLWFIPNNTHQHSKTSSRTARSKVAEWLRVWHSQVQSRPAGHFCLLNYFGLTRKHDWLS